jgi:glycosyltransferase involved in cell wall biosynthesis
MRILVVTHYFPEHGGGVEIAAQHIAEGLIARGFEIEWIASREVGQPSAAPGAHPVWALNVSERLLGIPYPIWGPDALGAIKRTLRRCDVLHLHDSLYMGNVMAYWCAKRLNKPVVVTQHIGLVPYRQRVFKSAMEIGNRLVSARILAGAAATVFFSKTTEDYFGSLLPEHLRKVWIPNGLDTALYHPLAEDGRRRLRAELGWPQEQPVLLFVGRFVEKKGMAILEQLAPMYPAARWVFVGWGPHDPSSWKAANVVNLGRQHHRDIVRLYQASDLLVLPSVGEGFPLVVQESMACGTPVAVSTETARAYPGVQDVVWSAEPTPTAFGRLLQELLRQPDRIAARREVTATFARREWNRDACVDQYAALMQSVRPH